MRDNSFTKFVVIWHFSGCDLARILLAQIHIAQAYFWPGGTFIRVKFSLGALWPKYILPRHTINLGTLFSGAFCPGTIALAAFLSMGTSYLDISGTVFFPRHILPQYLALDTFSPGIC